jgi:uncharacterized protein YkwD
MKVNRWKSLLPSTALGILITLAGCQLNARPQPNPAAKEDANRQVNTLTASSAAPAFPVPTTTTYGRRDNTPQLNTALLGKQMVGLVNAERRDPANRAETAGHERPLRWDPRLAQAAVAHSKIMASRHALSHYDPNGNSPVERIYKVGVQWTAMGENVAANITLAAAEAQMMNEPRFQANHRGNILSKKYNSIGIGIVRGADGRLYITQDFAEEPQAVQVSRKENSSQSDQATLADWREDPARGN